VVELFFGDRHLFAHQRLLLAHMVLV
jgi:hypothetical protein